MHGGIGLDVGDLNEGQSPSLLKENLLVFGQFYVRIDGNLFLGVGILQGWQILVYQDPFAIVKEEIAKGLLLLIGQPLARENSSVDVPFVQVEVLVDHQPMVCGNIFASAMIVKSQDRQGVRVSCIAKGTNRLGTVVEYEPFVGTAFVFAGLEEVDGLDEGGVP